MVLRSALRRFGVALSTGVLAAVGLAGPALAAGQGFTITDAAITDSAGLATDSARGLYWTANATTTPGIVYSINSHGATTRTVTFLASPSDVEGLAYRGGALYVGDIGDKTASRSNITVYRLTQLSGGATVYNAWDFRYPDGKHDAGTLLVSPRNHIYIVTRGSGAAIYLAPTTLSTQKVNTLTRVATAPTDVNDGTWLANGNVVLRTVSSLVLLDPNTWATKATVTMPVQQGGDAITTALSGGGLVAGSTTSGVATLLVSTPSSSAGTSSASASASASAAASEEEIDVSALPSPSNNGRTIAISIAALVALAAAAVVALKR